MASVTVPSRGRSPSRPQMAKQLTSSIRSHLNMTIFSRRRVRLDATKQPCQRCCGISHSGASLSYELDSHTSQSQSDRFASWICSHTRFRLRHSRIRYDLRKAVKVLCLRKRNGAIIPFGRDFSPCAPSICHGSTRCSMETMGIQSCCRQGYSCLHDCFRQSRHQELALCNFDDE